MSEYHYVWGEYGDWEGLYHKGKLVLEGHTISIGQLADYLNLDLKCVEVPDVNCESGNFPDTIEELSGFEP